MPHEELPRRIGQMLSFLSQAGQSLEDVTAIPALLPLSGEVSQSVVVDLVPPFTSFTLYLFKPVALYSIYRALEIEVVPYLI